VGWIGCQIQGWEKDIKSLKHLPKFTVKTGFWDFSVVNTAI